MIYFTVDILLVSYAWFHSLCYTLLYVVLISVPSSIEELEQVTAAWQKTDENSD